MNFDARDANCPSVQCAVCEKLITGGNWFARIKHGDWIVALCCPLCTDTFEQNPRVYIRRVEAVEFMRQSQRGSQPDGL